jgi:hypothetical protein
LNEIKPFEFYHGSRKEKQRNAKLVRIFHETFGDFDNDCLYRNNILLCIYVLPAAIAKPAIPLRAMHARPRYGPQGRAISFDSIGKSAA